MSDNVRDTWADVLSELLLTVDRYRYTAEADWSEYDCVFTDENPLTFEVENVAGEYEPPQLRARWSQSFASHLDLFVIYGQPSQQPSQKYIGAWPEESEDGKWVDELPQHVIRLTAHVRGRHVTRVEGLGESLSLAVDQTLAKVAKQREKHVVYELVGSSDSTSGPPEYRPLLLGPSDKPLAVTWARASGASTWVVPKDAQAVMTLVRSAFAEWHDRDAKRYPRLPNWDTDRRFRTAGELRILDELARLQAAFEESRDAHEAHLSELRERLEEASNADGVARRALLRADGAELEKAVQDALSTLGFSVELRDEVNTVSKREDLRITDPDDPDWLAICEVKGYKGGAGLDALRQVEHHAGLFARDEGKLPSKWVIVNAQRLQDPGSREVPYVTRADDLGSLEDTGGLVVDTRALFEALQLVEGGVRGRDEVRVLLRESVGVLAACPPIALEPGPTEAS